MPIQYYYIKTKADGYKGDIRETYINHRKNHLRIGLVATEKKIDSATAQAMPQDSIGATTTVAPDSTWLPAACRPNNLVFLMEVSSSLAKEEKLALMKASIVQLAKVLRPPDQIHLLV